ncbi:MAG: alpha-amylase [Clostridiales bacterium]|nr:alpha-amylase [Clostridiales bacterium]
MEEAKNKENQIMSGVMMQYFEWYYPEDGSLWKRVKEDAAHLAEIGITGVWLPPAYKGQAGIHDVGYGVYDLYDLGEFDQKGTIRTKYGTKQEYLEAVKALQDAGVQVYADMVFNHKMGADGTEQVSAREVKRDNRMQELGSPRQIEAWTRFDFPGRGDKYSSFHWNHTHFDGVDWDQRERRNGIYRFEGCSWDSNVDAENGNYDYLMGADLNFENSEVAEELTRFGRWYLDTVHMDGFRLDANKHISASFFGPWLAALRRHTGKELFTVGEYWGVKVDSLEKYLDTCGNCMHLFDVPLHMNLHKACHSNGQFDMRNIFKGTLVERRPCQAVTFVENHDTQEGQALQSVVSDWFAPGAYALILLRRQGYPCIFYGSYYGTRGQEHPALREKLDVMLHLRNEKMYGAQHDYLDHPDLIGWTFEGDAEHPGSGLAVLLTDGPGGKKRMYAGKHFAGKVFRNLFGGQTVAAGADGTAEFFVDGGSLSVWCCEEE